MRNSLLLAIITIFINSYSTAQNNDKINYFNSKIVELKKSLLRTKYDTKVDQLNSSDLKPLKKEIDVFCKNNDCQDLKNKISELENSFHQRIKDINSKDFYDLGLKEKIDGNFEKLEAGLKEIKTRDDLRKYSYKYQRQYTSINYELVNKASMEPWTTKAKNKMEELTKNYKKKERYIMENVPYWGNINGLANFYVQVEEYSFSGVEKQKYMSNKKKLDEINKQTKNKFKEGERPESSSDKELYDKWLKLLRKDKQLKKDNSSNFLSSPMLVNIRYKDIDSVSTHAVYSCDTAYKKHKNLNLSAIPMLTQNKLNSDLSINIKVRRTGRTQNKEIVPNAELNYQLKLYSRPAENKDNVIFYLDLSESLNYDKINFSSKNLILLYDINLEKIKEEIVKHLSFNYEIKVIQ